MAAAYLDGVTLVIGLGKTGLSCIRTLHALGAGQRLRVTDSRPQPPELAALKREFPDLPCYVGGFADAAFAGISRIIISPGVATRIAPVQAAIARNIPVWGDIELFARLTQAPVAAITGSNGKSTVTALLGLMAEKAGVRVAVGGNLGTPVLELLNQPGCELYVLELSSFQLETTYSLKPAVAALLNISPDHMDRYASIDDYIAAKQRIFRHARHRVINADDPITVALNGKPDTSWFTCAAPVSDDTFGLSQHQGQLYLAQGREAFIPVTDLKIAGKHNLANALAALAMASALKLPRRAIIEALQTFTGLPHRSQLVAEHNGVRWFDDSKGTNVGATIAAVDGLPGPLVLIAGGDGKGQDFSPLRNALAAKVRGLVLIGRDGPAIAASVADSVPVHYAADLGQAVELAATLARPGDNVLLSPACASFDMFKNYEERGRQFADAARRLGQCR